MHIGRKRLGNATLEVDDVLYIKEELQKGVSPRQLAELFEVGTETIRRIARGESWGWVKVKEAIPSATITDDEVSESLKRLMERKDDA